ncbi:hypothetical protein PC119_g23347 [Phytophthora cactorum]|nr:hypothetical protein PC119_g23347 [Phytophthora cactorum]
MPGWAAEATNGTGADFVIETGGSGTNAKSIDATKPGGQIGVIGFLSRAKQEEMPGVAGNQLTEKLVRVVTSQNIQPHIYETFGVDEEDS